MLESVNKEFKGKWVKTNNYDITKEAITKLVEKGYNNFVLLTQDPNMLMVRVEKMNGFIDTLEELGVSYKVQVIDDNITREELNKVINTNIDLDKKNLIFAVNGMVFQKSYDYIKTQNLNIPNNVGIIGFDD